MGPMRHSVRFETNPYGTLEIIETATVEQLRIISGRIEGAKNVFCCIRFGTIEGREAKSILVAKHNVARIKVKSSFPGGIIALVGVL